ncbi:MAG: 23S rRNA (adenine(2503)-C(2))-methyltransferase RlmN [Oscillospiraceae bacterium]|nr:23S rRNA (adenine(2503)-C(2))-methyltransferase RlmN [Oscillospiraceae bacterium]
MYDIKSMTESELTGLMLSMGQPGFRGRQIFRWLIDGAESFEEMTNLPATLRQELGDRCSIRVLCPLSKQRSSDGTVKLLWGLGDGNTVESVCMRYTHGNTVCVSTQVGCGQGCAFCASTRGGLVRNLEPWEMYEQVRLTGREAGGGISNVVLMGIGEPLENFDNVLRFFQLLNDPAGLNIGMRHISLSTCGPPGGIERLAAEGLQITLSVSLHAADDETRDRMMPVNRKSGGIGALIQSCDKYFERTGRRVSYEYLLADGVNDSDEQAEKLSRLLKGKNAHVNLIPLNAVDRALYRPSGRERVKSFAGILNKNGINATVRRKMGGDIDAACGQLRARKNLTNDR